MGLTNLWDHTCRIFRSHEYESKRSIHRRDATSNPPSRWQVQSIVEVPKYSENIERKIFKGSKRSSQTNWTKRMQNLQHRINRHCTIGASDGCRKNRRPSIGASLGAKWNQVKTALRHRFNWRVKHRQWCIQHTIVQRRCQVRSSPAFSTGRTDTPSVQCIGAMTSARKEECNSSSVTGLTDASSISLTDGPRSCCSCVREANG